MRSGVRFERHISPHNLKLAAPNALDNGRAAPRKPIRLGHGPLVEIEVGPVFGPGGSPPRPATEVAFRRTALSFSSSESPNGITFRNKWHETTWIRFRDEQEKSR